MKYDNKFERYTFAAVLLVFAAIIVLSFLDFPDDSSVEITGVVVTATTETEKETTEKETTVTKVNEIININTATVEELDTLDGIGRTRAEDIVAYRDYIGGFTSIEQLMDIYGIGEKIFEKIKNNITI